MRYHEITNEIEEMPGEWMDSDGIASRSERYIDDAKPYTTIGGLTVKKDVDRKITALLFYDKENLVGFAMLVDESNVAPNAVEIEIALEKPYQGRGIGMATYKFYSAKAYTIVSGSNQYPGAIAIWRKLMKDPSVKVMTVTPKDIMSHNPGYRIRPLKSPNEPWTTTDEYLRLMATKA